MDDTPDTGPNPDVQADADTRRQAAALADEEANKRDVPDPVGDGADGDLFERTSSDVRDMGTRPEPDRPPEGAVATKEDFLVQRDDEENVIPLWERIPGTETYALVGPMSNGEADRRLPSDGNALNLDDVELLGLIKEHIIEPDLSDAESLDDIKAFGVEPLVMCINNASGFNMARGVMSENSDLVELMQAVEGNSKDGNSVPRPGGSS